VKASKRSDARRIGVGLLVTAVLIVAAVSAPPAAAQAVQVPRAEFGEPFPAGKFQNLNEGAGGAAQIDLAGVLGKVPVILHYWMPGHARSEQVLLELQSLVESLGPGKLVLFAVTTPPMGSTDEAPIKARLRDLKLRVPCLRDEGLRLAQQTSADRVPAIALIDKEGKLRLTNGASLIQTVEYKTTLADLIGRLAKSGTVGNFGALPRYDPVVELVGKKAPDFQLPSLADGIPRRLSSLLAAGKVNVLVFWSVDCPHCKQYIPEINRWVSKNGAAVNVISVARVTNEALRTQTKEFARLSGLTFPTLVDQDFQMAASEYLVTATPTVLVLRPDGTVHGLMSPSEKDFGKYFEARRKEIFNSPPARS
jgi:thiol-disulfide isomerase/thioredoxin